MYVRGHSDKLLEFLLPPPDVGCLSVQPGARTGLREVLHPGRTGAGRAQWQPSPGGLGASLVTVTDEGLSQPGEGIGSGSNKQLWGGAVAYWAFLVHPTASGEQI